ncbi:hypothetical protein [Pelobacter propionicus]|uniref:HAMP domain-containing protein n=1 Tax=Pelobacter propionicus (strain DSM 2379 / NBRC 103807 / OttBd1) TaxID=338966 RepID=A1AM84_PELPD|nr:hypothetical protein [Pelobacter propionicus]ABK98454.1 hypothetical protein Ppro_0824 [Pelobacter propionicus DSM 2379]
MNKKHQRKFFVNIRYQCAQMAVGVFANILVVLATAALLSWFYLLEWDGSVAYNHNRTLVFLVLVSVCVATFTTVFFSLRRSRSVAGFLEKLHDVLDRASRGDFPEREVVFRTSDYYGHLSAPLNACLEQLRQMRDPRGAATTEDVRKLSSGIDRTEPDRGGNPRRLNELAPRMDSGGRY